MFKKCFIILIAHLLIQSCSKVDEFMLGKDNTPAPAELKSIKTKVNLVEKRSVSIGKPVKSAMYLKLQPVIKDKIIYTAEPGGLVQALDKKTFKPLWSRQLPHSIVSGPAVKNGYIALATNAATISLLSQDSGQEVWNKKLSSEALSSPVIAGDKVLVKTINGHLYAFTLADGKQLWVSDHGAPNLILKASSSPVILDQMALVGFSDGKLEAVDLQSGAVLWQRSIAYASGSSDVERLVDIDADPIVRDNIAYLATYQGYIGALSLSNGEFLWRKPASTYKNLAMDNNTIYMTDNEDVVWAFDRINGLVKWKQPALKARNLTEPVLLGNRLVLGDKNGYLHILSTQSGEFLSRHQLKGPIYSAPSISNNHIYVMTGNGNLNELAVS